MKICIISSIDCSNYLSRIGSELENVSVLVPSPGVEPLFPESCVKKLRKLNCKVEFISHKEEALLKRLKELNVNVLISIGWRWILSEKVINSVNTCINIHPAILPDYKGYHTEPYVIKNGESLHGITAHYLTKGLDDGDIIMQEKFPITPFSTVKSLKNKVESRAGAFFSKLFKLIQDNKVVGVPQSKTKKTTLAKKRRPSDSEIDPTLSLSVLFNDIRCCDPELYPAFFYISGRKVGVKLFSIDATKDDDFDI
jgi:methionyl-tRNA formyltransferase